MKQLYFLLFNLKMSTLVFLFFMVPTMAILGQISTSADCNPAVLEMENDGSATQNDNIATHTATFQEDTSPSTNSAGDFAPFSPTLTATYSLENLQNTGLFFENPTWDNMNSVGGGSANASWTSYQADGSIAPGTGISGSTNFGFKFNMQTAPLVPFGLDNGPHYYGDIVITFNRPVDDVILNFEDIGGFSGSTSFVASMVLSTDVPSTISKISGEPDFTVSGSTISAVSTFREGSVLVSGKGISVITLNSSLLGLDANNWNSSGIETFVIGASVLNYAGASNSISGNVSDDGATNLDGVTVNLYYDLDSDGVLDPEDTAAGIVATDMTDASGNYSFLNLPSDDYLVVEVQPAGYANISDGDASPDSGGDLLNVSTTDDIIPVSVCGDEADADNNFVESVILPIVLHSFDGNHVNRSVVLQWITASEINNSGFEIQHSIDGKAFKEIGFVESKDSNSKDMLSYAFNFTDFVPGNNYFRLKQIDFDGEYEVSKTIVVKAPISRNSIVVAPNPVNDVVNIITELDDIEVIITNMYGVEMSRFADNRSINISSLPSGMYVLSIVSNQNVSKSFRILKQ